MEAELLVAEVLVGIGLVQSDEVDVHSAPFFVNLFLAPVLLFRRRRKSVADVLKVIRNRGVHTG